MTELVNPFNILLKRIEEVDVKLESLIRVMPAKQVNEEKHLNRNEAAKYLGVSMPTLDRMSKEFDLPKSRVGGRVIYRKTDLDNAINNSRV